MSSARSLNDQLSILKMFIHVAHKLNWPILVVISVFALPLGGAGFTNLVEIWKVRSAPIVHGEILTREDVRKWGGIPATRLTIQVSNREDRVFAVMPEHTAAQFGRFVRFHYSGGPQHVVHVEGEDNPLWLVLFMWGLPALLWVIYLCSRGKPRWRSIVD
jgi:hypothetical protein